GVLVGESHDNIQSDWNDQLTVLIKFPKSYFQPISFWTVFADRYLWLGIILVCFLGFYILWRIYGRDTRVVSGVQYYPPSNIDPALAGYLIKDSANFNNLLSLLPYFGTQGYLSIEEIDEKQSGKEKDIMIKMLKPLASTAKEYEKSFFNG